MSDLSPEQTASIPHLSRTLGPVMLWGLGVGYVIPAMYFGWNLGLAEGGTYGMAIATFFSIIFYITFTFSFSYTELACAISKASGVFDYATRGPGKNSGFIAGVAMVTLNGKLALIYCTILAISYLWFHFLVKNNTHAA